MPLHFLHSTGHDVQSSLSPTTAFSCMTVPADPVSLHHLVTLSCWEAVGLYLEASYRRTNMRMERICCKKGNACHTAKWSCTLQDSKAKSAPSFTM